ncbi:MAG TPA: helix-turn-helix domain-containing protein [Flexivirga sp.]|uniref:helix-turn-helix domain-containing protein n=1 Tax=Flexivirga sp. TaxID=1962927 RepID=UPI002C3DCADF|nr:helix-turn-helix domain-containing protein [Flexivirga sp.]HWC20767.1 helix-turn-helix domain-containing protein [Flexivirga sp.]
MTERVSPATELAAALQPLLQRIGAVVVDDEPQADDVPITLHGTTIHVRVLDEHDLSDGLARLIQTVEQELGGRLSELPRAEKQHAVRLLEERGAFEMRRSAETVAEAMGMSRFTIYNYLNRVRG